jgi:hypothetical protein
MRPTLEDWARGSKDPASRLAAIYVLGLHADEASLRAIVAEQAVCCEDPGGRRTALRALAPWVADPAIQTLVMDRLTDETDAMPRVVVIQIASRLLDNPSVRTKIEQIAASDQDQKVRDAAWRALTCLRDYGVDNLPTALTPSGAKTR